MLKKKKLDLDSIGAQVKALYLPLTNTCLNTGTVDQELCEEQRLTSTRVLKHPNMLKSTGGSARLPEHEMRNGWKGKLLNKSEIIKKGRQLTKKLTRIRKQKTIFGNRLNSGSSTKRLVCDMENKKKKTAK